MLQIFSITFLLAIMVIPVVATGTVYLDFNDFPVTTGTTPGDSTDWEYSSSVTNNYPANSESSTSGWKTKTYQSDGYNWIHLMKFNGCYTHIGVGTYGYLSIDANGHSGNALKYTVTGGKVGEGTDDGSCVSNGTELYNLESYTGVGDIYTGGILGAPYIYIKKLNSTLTARNTSAFSAASGANRFSMYVWRPAGIVNGVGGYGNPVVETFQLGIFRDPESTGYHHYFNYLINGGGWIKIQVEETTNGDNGADGSTRYIPGLLQSAWQLYFTQKPYTGLYTPSYDYKYDDIEFSTDSYTPQNNETISNIAILYKGSGDWELSYNDKYKSSAQAHATGEVRYSLSGPITNENWSSATPVEIQADARFHITARVDGKFQKWWPYYQGMWAPFRLTNSDTVLLTSGTTVHFAIKDVSQNPLDLTDPNDAVNDYWGANQGGRNYTGYPAVFDFSEDEGALPYVKRISYTIAGSTPSPTCSDGIQNGDETGVDCGGSCDACSSVSMTIGSGTMAIGAGTTPISVQ